MTLHIQLSIMPWVMEAAPRKLGRHQDLLAMWYSQIWSLWHILPAGEGGTLGLHSLPRSHSAEVGHPYHGTLDLMRKPMGSAGWKAKGIYTPYHHHRMQRNLTKKILTRLRINTFDQTSDSCLRLDGLANDLLNLLIITGSLAIASGLAIWSSQWLQ